MSVVVRFANRHDAPAMTSIYNEYIVDSHVSFDTDPWTDAQRAAWLENRLSSGYPVLVAEVDGVVVGSAWSGPWRDKQAYESTVETTIVLDDAFIGRGVGTKLYARLLAVLADSGFHRAVAIVALPNDASLALHHKLGFATVGVLDEAGFKDDRYVSTMLLQRSLEIG